MMDSMPAKNIGAVVLMAGQSNRMGDENKLLLKLGKQTIASHCLSNLKQAGIEKILVVTGYQSDALHQEIEAYGVESIHNDRYPEGMGTSISLAFGHPTVSDWTGALVVLGDMPLIEVSTLERLHSESLAYPNQIIVPTINQRRGQPVIFPSSFFDRLQQCKGDVGGKWILQTHPNRVHNVDVSDQGVLLDVDSSESLETVRKLYTQRQSNG